MFWWAKFRHTKAGVKMHTFFDIKRKKSNVHSHSRKVHDVNEMDVILYETGFYYIFDRGYYDLKRLYHIDQMDAYLVSAFGMLYYHYS